MNPSILLVGNFLSASTGVRSICEDLAEQLAARGWTVLAASAKPGRIARVTDMISTVWRNRRSYDVAHVEVYGYSAYLWAELVCKTLRLIGKPFVLTLHGGNLPAIAERRPGRMRRLLASAVSVTTPSAFLREQMNQYRADIRLLCNPIDLSAYRFTPRANPRPNLIWLRAFHSIYNPMLAPQVIARLIEEFPGIQLTMVGRDKGSLHETKKLAAVLGVAHCINFQGSIPKSEVPVWLNRNDIFLNTTNVDNAPVSIVEAMACGLCVVSTNVGGIPYLLEHGRDALLAPANDADALASAVRQILMDKSMSARLAQNARAKAEQFDWTAVLPQWEKLLTDAANDIAGT